MSDGAMSASSSSSDLEQMHFKVILLGDGSVGKTSIAHRFGHDTFAKSYKQTIGLDWFSKQLELPDATEASLSLWDIGGQNMGGNMLPNYIYGANAILFVYDITSVDSFLNLEDWLGVAKASFAGRGPMPYMALVGNKSDLSHMRATKLAKHKAFAQDNNMYSFFVSAKTGDRINSTFYRIAADMAGIQLTQAQVGVQAPVVTAHVVTYRESRNDASESAGGRDAGSGAGARERPQARASTRGRARGRARARAMATRAVAWCREAGRVGLAVGWRLELGAEDRGRETGGGERSGGGRLGLDG
ncbi:member Ras oncogene family RAB28 [Thecamonas trahens ATCC 50062]|uniref:Member Ras oncogene family RAB28 n=1 Tax=Thecamonas trahens ATCC 50062 TaxID=461836 RepID=A0A0L0DSD0_THETB|nr:member Ras oncogene family RAB28 [Thecamonas trahens ATCC 50062]KNC54941.1 member Ras oncogene family RAB28 [Thecamonas trahens ATCC 50062]|eukprot:XP_013753391.1 member Ras oncogene family RAB28 [Thecamonas trahens ATCC 50062]